MGLPESEIAVILKILGALTAWKICVLLAHKPHLVLLSTLIQHTRRLMRKMKYAVIVWHNPTEGGP